MTIAPLWLESVPIQQLLNMLVDRLDAADKRGSRQSQSVALDERTWPFLYRADFESEKEYLWEHVTDLARWGWVQVKPDKAATSASGYALSPRLTPVNVEEIRRQVGRPTRPRSSSERWREAVATHLHASDEAKDVVSEYCIDLPDRSMAEVVQQLNRLQELAMQPILLREASARLFWGMSKVLDKRQGLVAAVLGTPESPFAESPIQMQVFLPSNNFESLLFVENQMSFEQAIRSCSQAFAGQALVFASGFRGSARRIRDASVYYSQHGELSGDARAKFEQWLSQDVTTSRIPTCFWGDLDWSGMRILCSMQTSFPLMTAWQPGYTPMLEALRRGEGHSPEAADKIGQMPVNATGCVFADSQLLPELAKRGKFIDQELFTF